METELHGVLPRRTFIAGAVAAAAAGALIGTPIALADDTTTTTTTPTDPTTTTSPPSSTTTTPTTTPATTTPATTTPVTTSPSTTTPATTTAPTTGPTTTLRPPDPIRDAPAVRWAGPRQVALTFDDGPRDAETAAVLDILQRAQVPATFFVNSYRVERWPALTRRAAAEGHSVQNHTADHAWLTKLKNPAVHDQLVRCSDVVQGVTGVRPTAFRPPFGATNARVDDVAAQAGLGKVMWNAGPSNMAARAPAILKETGKQMARYAPAGTGMVVLLHDGSGNRAGMLQALPALIDMFKAAGWQFVRIT